MVEFITLRKEGITDFAKERNELLKKAKGDWVFFVDTDETVSKDLETEISNITPKAVTEPQISNLSGYYVNRQNFFLGKYIGTDKILRLGRKNAGRWVRRVHEVWKVEGRIGQLKNPLVHNSAVSLHEFVHKINLYSTLHAQENLNNGKRSNLLKIVCYPVAKFIQSLLIGRGFVFSMFQSFHSFLSWGKAWQSPVRQAQDKQ